ncbi:zinc-dependent alcohol dehydrogenase [Aquisalibacillus elongatus]|uniref:L-iditol 2-dehydrogenase/L-idonate 5-dehydrogenase n=1 Tax=Aquisalibacillus elongatus TaxID=485577 RepID=A0A3N5BA22_9BACI|nr:alcohol dehydrogenase catalytic domain-containing protein [Aquisalibacillus elongatus]RPF54253.1 L-iditol 2-dehydrogenase/L-idonate 5-dehydrogenase [Aquisalibacillus elongatus]
MKAVVKHSNQPGDLSVKNIPLKDRSKDEVLVKINMASICGSDLHMYAGHSGYDWITYPLVLGHEMTGEVEDAEDASLIGRCVVINPYIPCGKCEHCLDGRENQCDNGQFFSKKVAPASLNYGFRENGGMAEYIVVPNENIMLLPEKVPNEVAAISEALAVGLTAIEKVKDVQGKSFVVFGPGPIGLGIASLLKGLGAGKIIMIGIPGDEKRLETAEQVGVDETVISDEALTDQLLQLSNGYDVIFDCSGHHSVPNQAVKLLKKGGELVLVGISTQEFQLQMDQIVRGEISVYGSYGITRSTFNRVLEYATDSAFPFNQLISKVYSFEDAKEAFDFAQNQANGKVILQF